MMKGIKITVGPLQTNCYIVYDDETKHGAIIDPGDEVRNIIDILRTLDVKIDFIILTHTHFDHIGAVDAIQQATGAPVLVSANEAYIKESWDHRLVNDGEKVRSGDLEFEFLLTPGHSEGSMCIKCQETIFTGDTLFKENCGRCDLPGGDYTKMLKSLKRLSLLEGNCSVNPGHGPDSTLNHERLNNPYMRESKYVDIDSKS